MGVAKERVVSRKRPMAVMHVNAATFTADGIRQDRQMENRLSSKFSLYLYTTGSFNCL